MKFLVFLFYLDDLNLEHVQYDVILYSVGVEIPDS